LTLSLVVILKKSEKEKILSILVYVQIISSDSEQQYLLWGVFLSFLRKTLQM